MTTNVPLIRLVDDDELFLVRVLLCLISIFLCRVAVTMC